MALIDVVVPSFLLTEPPLEGTQDAQLLASLVARLIYLQEPSNLLDNESEESTSESVQEVADKDFDVFYRTDALDTSQTHTLVEMGFEKKTSNLLTLLTAHAGGFSLAVVMVSQTPTPITTLMLGRRREKGPREASVLRARRWERSCSPPISP